MTEAQKEILRDCFEGCMGFAYAWQAAGIDNKKAFDAAKRTWARWTRQMDEEGYYTY